MTGSSGQVGSAVAARLLEAGWKVRSFDLVNGDDLRDEGAVPAKVLSVLTPATIGPKYFREIAAVVNAGGPPDPAQIKAVMEKHG